MRLHIGLITAAVVGYTITHIVDRVKLKLDHLFNLLWTVVEHCCSTINNKSKQVEFELKSIESMIVSNRFDFKSSRWSSFQIKSIVDMVDSINLSYSFLLQLTPVANGS